MRKNLTDAAVKSIKPDPLKRLEISDARMPALKLLVAPSGVKTWAVRYRFGNTVKKLTIGRADIISLADARDAADAALKLLKQGIDPIAAKEEAVAAAKEAERAKSALDDNLVEIAFERHIEKHVATLKSADELARILRKEVIEPWRGRRVDEIRKRDVIALLDTVAERGSPTMSNRVLSHVRAAFNWFISRDYHGVDINPCTGVKPVVAEVQRDRVLTDDELRLILRAADKMGYPWSGVVRLLAYTGVRRDEAAKLPWAELSSEGDNPVWLIPKERTKNGRPHTVPLTPGLVNMFGALPKIAESPFVFTTTGDTAVSGYGKAKERMDRLMLEIARMDAEEAGGDVEAVKVEEWRFHDLRRTAATGMAELGIAPHIIEAALNHISGAKAGVAGIYNRHRYDDEKRVALSAWSNKLEALESGKARDKKIIQFSRKN